MRYRLKLGHVTHILMIVTLCIALWKLLGHDNKSFTYKAGDRISHTIWKTMPDAKRTVIIVDRADCAFCKASMPFYSRLVQDTIAAGFEVVSVTSDNITTHQHYLDENHVHVDRIVQLKDTPLRISATPTLLVLDQSKTVLGAWVGELSSDEEDKVMHLVRTGSL